MKRKEIDILIKIGFETYCLREVKRLPTDEELHKLFPSVLSRNENAKEHFFTRTVGGIDN